jgi:hypothetical protein
MERRKSSPPATTRTCGACTLCCNLLPVPVLDKPRNEWCRHRVPGACSIYAERPFACREWSCLWLVNETIPAALRPDKSHVVFDIEPDAVRGLYADGERKVYQVAQAWVDPRFPKAYRLPGPRAVMLALAEQYNVATLCRIGTAAVLVAPPPLSDGLGWVEKSADSDSDWGRGDPRKRLLEVGSGGAP